jgi:hypothetical protein
MNYALINAISPVFRVNWLGENSVSAQQFWDERYQGEGYLYGTAPNDFLRSRAPALPPNSKVLCLAEGEGRNAVYLAQMGFEVTSIDISPVAIQKGKAFAEAKGVSVDWCCADLDSHPIGEAKWDAIVAIYMHLPPSLRQKVFLQIPKALTSNGYFIGEFYRKEQLLLNSGGPKDAEMLYCPTLLKQELNPLVCEHHLVLNREVIEGSGHNGMAAVVQVVARKV